MQGLDPSGGGAAESAEEEGARHHPRAVRGPRPAGVHTGGQAEEDKIREEDEGEADPKGIQRVADAHEDPDGVLEGEHGEQGGARRHAALVVSDLLPAAEEEEERAQVSGIERQRCLHTEDRERVLGSPGGAGCVAAGGVPQGVGESSVRQGLHEAAAAQQNIPVDTREGFARRDPCSGARTQVLTA